MESLGQFAERTRDELIASDVVSEWKPAMNSLCPKSHVAPVLCDCGFLGDWEYRWVYVWFSGSGTVRGDKACRRDIERGFPPRFGESGWWVIGGWDERCPQCGDVERFDYNADVVRQWSEQATVVRFLAARR